VIDFLLPISALRESRASASSRALRSQPRRHLYPPTGPLYQRNANEVMQPEQGSLERSSSRRIVFHRRRCPRDSDHLAGDALPVKTSFRPQPQVQTAVRQ
jgi:hypothetical protein